MRLNRCLVSAPLGLASLLVNLHTAQAQGDDAQALVREEQALVRETLCPARDAQPPNFAQLFDPEIQRMEPAQVFDNFYLLGMKTVVAWALETSEGIVLFESMFDHNVEDAVVLGLEKLGLDARDIKYVVIAHAHADHFGGAKYLQDAFGARIVMSVEDWEYMHAQPLRGAPPPYPQYDIAVQDGHTIQLGDTTINLFVTPGHTPGTISSVFPVRDGDEVHYLGYLGGSGIPQSPDAIIQFMGSLDRFAYVDRRVDTYASNHPMVDGTLLKLDALGRRRSRDPHPFVSGNARFKDWLSLIHNCAGEALGQRLDPR